MNYWNLLFNDVQQNNVDNFNEHIDMFTYDSQSVPSLTMVQSICEFYFHKSQKVPMVNNLLFFEQLLSVLFQHEPENKHNLKDNALYGLVVGQLERRIVFMLIDEFGQHSEILDKHFHQFIKHITIYSPLLQIFAFAPIMGGLQRIQDETLQDKIVAMLATLPVKKYRHDPIVFDMVHNTLLLVAIAWPWRTINDDKREQLFDTTLDIFIEALQSSELFDELNSWFLSYLKAQREQNLSLFQFDLCDRDFIKKYVVMITQHPYANSLDKLLLENIEKQHEASYSDVSRLLNSFR